MPIDDNYRQKGLRNALVRTLSEKGIKTPSILEAIGRIPRHIFLDNAFLEHAYQDKAFPIADGQTISQPYTVAFQTELLEIKKGDRVLEIGTGSGYQACVLAELGANVFTIERSKPLYEQSRMYIKHLGYKNIYSHYGDGTKGLPLKAPFDKIIVTAGAPIVPNSLLDQLKIGGLFVIPVGDKAEQHMIRIKKTDQNKIIKENYGIFKFVPMIGEEGW